jgi:signal transduction histidine kinase
VHRPQQGAVGERFLDQQHVGLEDTLVGDHLVGVSRDVDHRKGRELPADLVGQFPARHFEDELRRRNEDLETFASQAAHDLKSPLAGIMLITEVLGHPKLPQDDAVRRQIQEDIRTLAERGTQLVTDLLAVARQDWASGILATTVVDAEALVWAILDEEKLPDAEVRVSGEWRKVRLPEGELRSVFANLVGNASHYGRDESGHLDLAVTAVPAGDDDLTVTIEDRGRGISPALRDRIFDPFVTADDSLERNPASTGLGLALVKRTVERRGGTVRLLDGRPVGSAFAISLPLADPPPR